MKKRKRNRGSDDLTIEQRRALLQMKIRHDVEKHGCFVMCVFPVEEGQHAWAYSIGIPTTIPGASEIVIFGIPYESAAHIINNMVEQMREGKVFEAGSYHDGILKDYPAYFGRVDEKYYEDYFGQAIIYHNGLDFPVLELCWPSPQGQFPWQEGYPERFKKIQPLLFHPPVS